MLDRSTHAILGYLWLHQKNPTIDWVMYKLTFWSSQSIAPSSNAFCLPPSQTIPELTTPPSASASAGSSTTLQPPDSATSADLHAAAAKISILVINATAARLLQQLPQSHPQSILFSGLIKPATLKANAATTNPAAPQFKSSLASETAEITSKVPSPYHEFIDVFSKIKVTTLLPHHPYDHQINLEDGTSPPFGPIYSLSTVEQLALKQFINKNLSSGLICPSQSSAGVPILFIQKKDSSLCLAMDYRGLNRITKKDWYPLPLIPDLLDCLNSAKVFTKIDLCGAYNLIHIAKGNEWKTAFRTCFGSYKFLVMHYGLTNTPASFQRFMNDIFKDMLNICMVVYLDDILIYSRDAADHTRHVQEVLHHLRSNDLFTKLEKCDFSVDTTNFLGFIISPEGLKMDDLKIKVIQDWPAPHKVKDVQSFLGFTNFYHCFIANYSNLTVLLDCLTCKNTLWYWLPACDTAFRLLKDAFTMAPILHHFNPSLPPIVKTDTSNYTIASILLLHTDDSDVHPVTFFSCTLMGAELNYDTHDKELLAIFHTFKTWCHYLGSPHHTTDVVMDHKNLEYFSSTKTLTRHQARWSQYLSAFNMIICFHPGKLGEKPDSLTHRADYYLKREDRDFTLANPQNLCPIFTQEQLTISLCTTLLRPLAIKAASLTNIPIPLIDSAALIEDIKASYKHNTITQRKYALCINGMPSPCYTLSSSGLLLLNSCVYIPDHHPDCGHLRTCVLQEKHNHPTAGHFSFNKTLELLQCDYLWPSLHCDCKSFVLQCVLCAQNKPSRHHPYGLLQPLPIPECLWHSISMDFIEQLLPSDSFTAILVIINCLLKESIFIPTTNNATAVDVADTFVSHIFAKHSIPLHVSLDCSSKFTSHFFRSLGSLLCMRLHFTSGHQPSANSQVEHINSTLEQYLRIYCNYQQSNWSKLLPLAEFAYNNAPHKSTSVLPFFATCGYDLLIAIYPDAEVTNL